MIEFNTNSQLYNVSTEHEIAVILSHFNSEFIFDIIRDNLQKKYICNYIANPNIVASFEQNFKNLKETYSSDTANIENIRIETYKEVISILCREYKFGYNFDPDMIDLYTISYYLYDFLVSNYMTHIIKFYAAFITRERNNLYEIFNIDQFRKNKDSTTLYNKRVYTDSKLAILTANLEYVIRNMSTFDISLVDILNAAYNNIEITNFLMGILLPTEDFYKMQYSNIINHDEFPIILTNIKLEIQRYMKDEVIQDGE